MSTLGKHLLPLQLTLQAGQLAIFDITEGSLEENNLLGKEGLSAYRRAGSCGLVRAAAATATA